MCPTGLRSRAPCCCVTEDNNPVVFRTNPELTPELDERLIAQVKQDIWETAMAPSSAALARAQGEALIQTMQDISTQLEDLEQSGQPLPPMTEAAPDLLPRSALDAAIAPRLALLMLPDYPLYIRKMLSMVRTPRQQRALLLLNQYVTGAYEEMADKVVDMQWLQLQKLRDLCEAAMEGGSEQLHETALLMKEEFDTDFCNYLNYAIEQEEARLRGEGIEPLPERRAPPAVAIEDDADSYTPPLPSTSYETSAPRGSAESATAQQWLLLLRLVKRGVYSLLATERDEAIKQVRYITNLASAESRAELTRQTLDQMGEEEMRAFAATVVRIADNLSVQRDARDRELHEKVGEIKAAIQDYITL